MDNLLNFTKTRIFKTESIELTQDLKNYLDVMEFKYETHIDNIGLFVEVFIYQEKDHEQIYEFITNL